MKPSKHPRVDTPSAAMEDKISPSPPQSSASETAPGSVQEKIQEMICLEGATMMRLLERIKELEEEKERILQRDNEDASLVLLLKRTLSENTTAGAENVKLKSKTVKGTQYRVEREEILPEDCFLEEIGEGDLTLIFYNRNKLLNTACRHGITEIVERLIKSGGVDLNNRCVNGLTPVFIAAWCGREEVFDLLVKQGCDLSLKLYNGNNILHVACFGGSVDIVSYLISNRIADIESKGMSGATPVMKAVNAGHKNVFDLLVSKGCDLSIVDKRGNNILHIACLNDNVEIVEFLVSHNVVSLESKGENGMTPVLLATENGRKEIFDLLVSWGCDLTAVDAKGNNILHLACMGNNVSIVSYIISHGTADIESRGHCGRRAVFIAAMQGQKDLFDLLVSKGCDLSGSDETGENILHLACIGGNREIVEYIISHTHLDIESRGKYGRTPLMKAAERGEKDIFDLLVSKGCDLSVVDETGNNVLHIACFSHNTEIVEYLIMHDIADIDCRGKLGRTAVMFAAEKGQEDVFHLLVSKGCDLSIVDKKGDNILHIACFGDSVKIVDYLISKKIADIDSRGHCGRTPVMRAAEKGNTRVLDYLVGKGCDVMAEDDYKNNTLQIACQEGNSEVVEYLWSKTEFDIDRRNRYGRTPVMIEAQDGSKANF